MDFTTAVASIRPLDPAALKAAHARQPRLTKPLGSLGVLEDIANRLCGIQGQCPPAVPARPVVTIFTGDHGVHAQGVSPWPQEVTFQMAANILGGGAAISTFSAQLGIDISVIDMGAVNDLPDEPRVLNYKVRPGTADMTVEPAMTREDAIAGLEAGIAVADRLIDAGYDILLTGDMGIANTTASAALIAAFTGADPRKITGRGTGIGDDMYAKKVSVVQQALALHSPDPADPIGVLSAVGGLEHAGIAGMILGAARRRVPVILDGVIADSSALVAYGLCPTALDFCVAGHRSAEPAARIAMEHMGIRAVLELDLRLGEGTGSSLALPLVQCAARSLADMATFEDAGVSEG